MSLTYRPPNTFATLRSSTGKVHILAGEGIGGGKARCRPFDYIRNYTYNGWVSADAITLSQAITCKACLRWAAKQELPGFDQPKPEPALHFSGGTS